MENLSTNVFFAEYVGLEFSDAAKYSCAPYYQGASSAQYDGGKIWIGEFLTKMGNKPDFSVPNFGNFFSTDRLRFTTDWNWLIEVWKKANIDFEDAIRTGEIVFQEQHEMMHPYDHINIIFGGYVRNNQVTEAAFFLEDIIRHCKAYQNKK